MPWNLQDGKRADFNHVTRAPSWACSSWRSRCTVHDEVERAHGGHGPEEVVEAALIEVVVDPPSTVRRGRERRHDGVDERAQVAP